MPQTAYDTVPYTSHAYARTHPDNLAAMARLFGVPAPDPRTARVLEMGCGRGGNLIPMAAACPRARFTGFDLSRVQIREARDLSGRLGLENLDLRHADILDVDAAWGEFDYVIAHGIWSWVPGPVRDAIFRIVRDRLSRQGVAYISYNVLPGWRTRGMVAELMRYHTRRLDTPADRVRHARVFLELLSTIRGPDVHTPYIDALHEESVMLAGLPDSYLLHDHLGDVNHQVYFHEFEAQARAHGLAFLSESHLADMMPSGLGADAKQFLARFRDQAEREQYLDFLVNRAFRTTLLVHDDVPLNRVVGWSSLMGLHLQCAGTLSSDTPKDDPGNSVTLTVEGRSSRTSSPIVKAALRHLCELWPGSAEFERVVDAARSTVRSGRPIDDDRADVGGALLGLVVHRLVTVRATPSPAVPGGPDVRLFPVARQQIEDGAALLTNALHAHVRVDPEAARALLDPGKLDPSARERAGRLGLWLDADR